MKYPALGGVPIYSRIYVAIYGYIIVMWILKCVSWVSGLVFCVSGLVFGCLDLYFGCQPTPVVYDPACGAFFFWKMTPLDFLNTYIVKLVDVHQFEVPPCIFFKKWTICPNGYASKTRIDFLF